MALLVRQYSRDRYVEFQDTTSRRALLEVLGQSLCAECGTLLTRNMPTITAMSPGYVTTPDGRTYTNSDEYAVTVCLGCAPTIVARLAEADALLGMEPLSVTNPCLVPGCDTGSVVDHQEHPEEE
jgi:hypothetical protein